MYPELNELNGAWKGANVEDNNRREFEKLPDGTYQAHVEEARIERSKKSERLQIAFVFDIVAPHVHRGRKIFHYRGLDDPERIGWAKQDIYNMGLVVEDLTELPDLLPNLLDRVIEIGLKTNPKKPDYQNVYINRVVNEGGYGERHDSLPVTDDEIAF